MNPPVSALERLRAEESARVLRLLIDRRNELPEIELIARNVVCEFQPSLLVEEVERAVLELGMEELGARSGRMIFGYVEPTEVAWALLNEALQPFLDDLKRSIELGFEAQAIARCQAIVLGLYQANAESSRDLVLEWAPDFPLDGAGAAVRVLEHQSRKLHRKRWSLPAAFLDQIPNWARHFRSSRAGARTRR